MKERFVLDASALLSILLDEPGEESVHEILDRCQIHSVNLAEVIRRLVRSGMPWDEAMAVLDNLDLDIHEGFVAEEAAFCGILIAKHGELGLSLGDGVCLTTAAWSEAVAVTADRRWKELEGEAILGRTIRVKLIR